MATASASDKRPSRRRWFRFSLRTLFVALTVTCLWLGFEVTQARRQRAAVQSLEKVGARLAYNFASPVRRRDELGFQRRPPMNPVRQWIADTLGIDYAATVVQVHGPMSATIHTEDLAALADLPDLELLELSECKLVDDDLLARLPPNEKLKYLGIGLTSVTDEGARQLNKFPSLERLNISDSQITDEGLAAISRLRKLNFLKVAGPTIGDRGIRELRSLPDLTVLELAHTSVGDESMESIGTLHNLAFLVIYGGQVTDAGLVHLKGLEHLDTIWLSRTRVQGPGLHHLAECSRLTHLSLEGCPLNEEASPALAGVRSLVEVDLRYSTMPPQAVAELQSRCPTLRIKYP